MIYFSLHRAESKLLTDITSLPKQLKSSTLQKWTKGLEKFRCAAIRSLHVTGPGLQALVQTGKQGKAGGRCPLFYNWFLWGSLLHSLGITPKTCDKPYDSWWERGTKTRKQKGGSPLSWNWFLFSSLLHSLGVSPLFFKKRLGKGDDGDLYDKIDDVDVENDGIILGLRYWANYLLKPDRSNSLSCNKIQFRFWSIRQCPIPSHLISLKKFGNSLTRSLFSERPPDIEAWEIFQIIDLSLRVALLSYQLKQYLNCWHPIAWTEEVPCKATNVKKKPRVCWLTRRRGWPRLTL